MFYKRFTLMCRILGLEPTKAAQLAGFSTGSSSYWKKMQDTQSRISNATIIKMSHFFMVDPSFLTGDKDSYKSDLGFTTATENYPYYLSDIICGNLKKLTKLYQFDPYTSMVIDSIVSSGELPSIDELSRFCEEAGVDLSYLFGPYSYCLQGKEARDNDVRVALFGGDVDVTDEMWNEAKAYAALIVARQKNQKGS